MPDSLTNIEMNDVLSSIRRLVSEKSEKNTEVLPEQDDRFILTPAHRVEVVETDIDTVRATDDDAEIESTEQQELSGVLAAAASAASGTGETAGLGEQSAAEEAPQSAEFDAMEVAWKAELARVATAEELGVEGVEPTDQDAEKPAPSLELRIAELEEAVGQSEDEWEPDGSEPEANQKPRRHIFEVVNNMRQGTDSEPADEAEDATPVFSHSAEPRPKPYLLSQETTADTDFEDEDQPEAIEQADVDREAAFAPAATVATEVVEDDDVFLDVEALRTMVGEVVREELRGKLGESITRNVRRMMQQEIAQAITKYTLEDDDEN